MDLKEVFRYSCIVFLIHCNIRFSTSCLPYVKVLFFQITLYKYQVRVQNLFSLGNNKTPNLWCTDMYLDIYVEDSSSNALPGRWLGISKLCKLKLNSVISILKSNAIVSQWWWWHPCCLEQFWIQCILKLLGAIYYVTSIWGFIEFSYAAYTPSCLTSNIIWCSSSICWIDFIKSVIWACHRSVTATVYRKGRICS